jgi:hypothetical protein
LSVAFDIFHVLPLLAAHLARRKEKSNRIMKINYVFASYQQQNYTNLHTKDAARITTQRLVHIFSSTHLMLSAVKFEIL